MLNTINTILTPCSHPISCRDSILASNLLLSIIVKKKSFARIQYHVMITSLHPIFLLSLKLHSPIDVEQSIRLAAAPHSGHGAGAPTPVSRVNNPSAQGPRHGAQTVANHKEAEISSSSQVYEKTLAHATFPSLLLFLLPKQFTNESSRNITPTDLCSIIALISVNNGSGKQRDPATFYAGPVLSAWSRSLMRSSTSSMPTDIRMRSSVRPRSSRTAAGIAAWDMKHGRLMRDFTLPAYRKGHGSGQLRAPSADDTNVDRVRLDAHQS